MPTLVPAFTPAALAQRPTRQIPVDRTKNSRIVPAVMRRSFLLILAALFAATFHASAQDASLFDAKHSVKANADVQKVLGPKSAGLRYDPRMIRAAQIALSRAYPHPTWRCWHYVKDALVDAQVIKSRPSSSWAKEAGTELCEKYGFQKLNVRSPLQAPVGAVLVYGGPDAGHVEIRTATGFVSDFVSATPYPRPFLGAYVKPS